jgi:hypothetical protein
MLTWWYVKLPLGFKRLRSIFFSQTFLHCTVQDISYPTLKNCTTYIHLEWETEQVCFSSQPILYTVTQHKHIPSLLLPSAGIADLLRIHHLTQYKASNPYTNSGSKVPSGICITVTKLVSPKVQMCFLVIQHLSRNQHFPRFVDTDAVTGISIVSWYLHQWTSQLSWQLLFRWSSIQISAQKLSILAETFHGSAHSLPPNKCLENISLQHGCFLPHPF